MLLFLSIVAKFSVYSEYNENETVVKIRLYFTWKDCKKVLINLWASTTALWSVGGQINRRYVIPNSGNSNNVAFTAFLEMKIPNENQ